MKQKILVVDDDPAVHKMLTLLLETTGEILLASTGEEALKLVAAERPRLMMLDMVMPGMGGLETLKAVRAIAPAMTVIMLTGKNDMELAKRSLDLGASEFVTKPFDLSRLKDKVQRTLGPVPAEDRNAHGLPWRIAAAAGASSTGAGLPAPTDGAISRWEGEGGHTETSAAPDPKSSTAPAPKPQFISRAELKAMIDDKEKFRLWNVLTAEFHKSEANIPGSQWIPVDAIAAKVASDKAAGLGEAIVVYCGGPAGPSAKQAASKLRDLGCTNVYVYDGGLDDWSGNGLPFADASPGDRLTEIK